MKGAGILVFLFLCGTAGVSLATQQPEPRTEPVSYNIPQAPQPSPQELYAACMSAAATQRDKELQSVASAGFAPALSTAVRALALFGISSPELDTARLRAGVEQHYTNATDGCKHQYVQ